MATKWLVVLGLVAGCTKPNPAVCCNSPGDCNAIGIMDSQRSCAAGFVCTSHVCSLPADGGASLDSAPVGCTQSSDCPATSPVCDSTTRSCRACAADSECISNVCDADSGLCVSADSVLYASPTGGTTATCAVDDPCSLGQAISAVTATKTTIKLASGTYIGSITISGKSVAIHGSSATLQVASGAQGLEIQDGANVLVTGLTISELSGGNSIRCETTTSNATTPQLRLESIALDAQDTGIAAVKCSMFLSQSTIHVAPGKPIFGVLAPSTAQVDRTVFDGGDGIYSFGTGAALRITNSVFANQTGQNGAFIGGQLISGGNGSLSVSFSTVINSVVSCANGVPVCQGGSDAGACIDNTIFLNTGSGAPADTITGTACVANYVIAMPQSTALTGANNKLGVDPMLVNPSAGDYHLKSTSPAVDAADPTATVTPDLDGTPRPQGARADIGAYEYKP